MDHTKMYHLVEPRILENLDRQQGIPDPRLTNYHKLDGDMQSLLTDDRPTTTDDETLKVYNQKLMRQRMMHYQYANHRPPVKVEVVQPSNAAANVASNNGVSHPVSNSNPSDDTEREIYDSVPKSMQRKAKLLIDKIKSRSDMRWNDKGELVYKRKVVPGSNIVDLVNDTMRKRKHFEPTGWEVLATGLKEANVPQELVGNSRQWDYMKKAQAAEEEEEEDSFGFSTPLASHTPSFATRKATPLWARQDKPDDKSDGYEEPESETRNEALKELSKRWKTADPTTDPTSENELKLGKPLSFGKSLEDTLRTSHGKRPHKVIGSKRLSPYVTTPKSVRKWKPRKV